MDLEDYIEGCQLNGPAIKDKTAAERSQDAMNTLAFAMGRVISGPLPSIPQEWIDDVDS